jgi:signal transduction histidine kinase
MEPWLEHFAETAFRRAADTAHDLKTPLNVAVLNLELLRMRMRKVAGDDDEKLNGYAQAIEGELRRMGRIFDTYFLLATPPKSEERATVDVASVATEAAADSGFALGATDAFEVSAHASRIRQAVRLFFEGSAKVLHADGRTAAASSEDGRYVVAVTGVPVDPDLELTKIFKFYYSDPDGNPDLSLATARLVIETSGGELVALQESDKVTLRLSVPPGER